MVEQLEQEGERGVVMDSRDVAETFLPKVSAYSRAAAVNDVLRRVVHLTLHLHRLLLLVAHSHVEDPEVTSTQVQSNEVSLF